MDPHWIALYPTEILERIIIYTCTSAHTNLGEPLKRIIRPDFDIEYDFTSTPLASDTHASQHLSSNRRLHIEAGVTFQYSMQFRTEHRDVMRKVNTRVRNLAIPGRWKEVFQKIWPCVLALDGGDRIRFNPLRDALYLDCGNMFGLWDFVDRFYDPNSIDKKNGLGNLVGFQHFTKLFLSIVWFNTIGMFDLKFNYNGLFAGINENSVALKTKFPGSASVRTQELMTKREVSKFRIGVTFPIAYDEGAKEGMRNVAHRIERSIRNRIENCFLKMDRESFDTGYGKPADPNHLTVPGHKKIEWVKGRNLKQDRLKEGELTIMHFEGNRWEDATSAQFDYVFENSERSTEKTFAEGPASHLLSVDVNKDLAMAG